MTAQDDHSLTTLFEGDPVRGWRAFIDQYTALIVRLIRRAGVRDQDEVMDIYTRVCDRLSADGCARIRRRRPGSIEGWLAVVVRHAAVDWVRSRTGRRRLFGVIQQLAAFDQRVFELFYWQDLSVPEIAARLESEQQDIVSLAKVFDAMTRINRVLTERHRSELLSWVARSHAMEGLEDSNGVLRTDAPTEAPNPEDIAAAAESAQRLEEALRSLPAEDAAIVRLHFTEGLSLTQVRHLLRLDELSDGRVTAILGRLREVLSASDTHSPQTNGVDR